MSTTLKYKKSKSSKTEAIKLKKSARYVESIKKRKYNSVLQTLDNYEYATEFNERDLDAYKDFK